MNTSRWISRTLMGLLLAAVLAAPARAAAAPTPPAPSSWASGAASTALRPEPKRPDAPVNQWVSTQLHPHSWSNHNGAVQPGSIQYHTQWASSAGLDVLWWADHNPIFTQTTDMTFGFSQATIDPGTLNVTIPLPPGVPWWSVYDYVTLLKASVSGGVHAAANLVSGPPPGGGTMLQMQLKADDDPTFDRFEYVTLTTDNMKIQGSSFPRALATDPVLSFDASRCDNAGSDSFGEVRVRLSWHNYGTPASQNLVYRLVPAGQPGGIVQSSTHVTVTVPLDSSHVEAPLLEHASLLTDGDDNAIQEMFFAVGARNGAEGCMTLGNFKVTSRRQQTSQIIQLQKDMFARHQATYGVAGIFTWEQFAGQRHLNPYLPSTSTLQPGVADIQVENFVPLIHGQNGLVMLNHVFGAGFGALLPPDQQEALVQSALSTLLPVQAWNTDMFEIYRSRARVDLAHHMRLWDLLGANGVQICATTTSDTHGGPFTLNHAMVVWIDAASADRDDLLAGMRSCRLFFGDLSRFDGVLDLRLGSTSMGSVYPARPGVEALHVILDPLPAGAQVKLVQQLLQPGTELVHLIDHQVIDPTEPVMIDVSQPSQVRVEVWSSTGQMMAFSNRIVIENLQCDVNNSGQIDVSDVQLVVAAFGQSTPPAPAGYDLRPDGVIDLWDIIAAGECWQQNHLNAPA